MSRRFFSRLLVSCAIGNSIPSEIGDDRAAIVLRFGENLEAADHLSYDEQEELIGILHRRVAQVSRERIETAITESRQEFADGRCVPTTSSELMHEITK